MTLYPDAAHAAATCDRQATADLVIGQACREVLAAYRLARRCGVSMPLREAAAELERAGNSAGRMLGGESPC